MNAPEISAPGVTRLAVGALGADVEICYVWDNGAVIDSACRLLRAGAAYYLHRGTWPPESGVAEVFVIPASVAIEMRRLVTASAERGAP